MKIIHNNSYILFLIFGYLASQVVRADDDEEADDDYQNLKDFDDGSVGMIGFFSNNLCPDGWEEYKEVMGKFVIGKSDKYGYGKGETVLVHPNLNKVNKVKG